MSAVLRVLAVLMLRFGLRYIDSLPEILNRFVERHVVGLRALLQVFDGQIVGISVIIVWKHAATS